MRSRIAVVIALISLSSYGVAADVRTEQKAQVQFAGMLGRMMNLFGGKAAREGITSTVAVKGNRKVTTTGTNSQIMTSVKKKSTTSTSKEIVQGDDVCRVAAADGRSAAQGCRGCAQGRAV